ncbi:MAG: hypothetical protein ACE37F_24290 [Nannocystaceae bacterium]|nr:hypothetical protein [bacterium]
MALDPAQHVQRNESIPAELELTPQDYFVLSRVEGSVKVGDLVRACGLPSSEASAIVNKLIDGGALTLAEVKAKPVVRRSTASLRAAAEARKRRALAAALAQGGRAPTVEVAAQGEDVSNGQAEDEGTDKDDELERIDRKRVPASDDRLDDSYPIDVDRQRWILAMNDDHAQMSQFEILGILPTHDVKAIKRAYHETSRALHPDAYHGRDLGPFRSILSSLFREAKAAYAELRREDVRAPWVDRRIEDDARARQEVEAEEAEARHAREAAAAERREERTRARAQRQREALQAKMQEEASAMLSEAEAAEKSGNLAKAANLYLLAKRADPANAELEAKWEAVRQAARDKRGTEAYARAQQRLDLGQYAEALPWLIEAAQAHPTAEHLAHAAFAVREGDPNMGRDLAMRALEALRSAEASGEKVRTAERVRLHVWIAYAFLAAGQVSTARAQAERVAKERPDDPDVRALLKACKAK